MLTGGLAHNRGANKQQQPQVVIVASADGLRFTMALARLRSFQLATFPLCNGVKGLRIIDYTR